MAMISTRKGAKVLFGGVQMKVVGARGMDALTLQSPDGEYFYAPLVDLEKEAAGKPGKTVVIDAIRQAKVPAYVKAFGSLLSRDRLTKAEVTKAGKEVGISMTSAYEAIKRFRESGSTDELPPPTRPGGKGQSRLKPQTEDIIQHLIDEMLLNRRNLESRAFYEEAKLRLKKAGLTVSQGTLRNRVRTHVTAARGVGFPFGS
jgi:putative transposase